ncbi:hypothetical protein ANCCEY_03689 [Ancylostoma ceylanicum]|uniref:Major facilitator superfamily (MFS) profile domain-containing protein n=1 Tax=Ancylostoma ceylanicum TaxID=53326 RepID=A0A0D6LZG6_9BILA|nr:hypothetical protein ANCCEY_03689 [Ancylostoma ceylanicum]
MKECEGSAGKNNGKAKSSSCGIETEHDAMTVMFMPWKAQDFTSRVIRHAAWLGVMVKIAYVFSGARCLRAFSTFILHTMGGWSIDSALYGSFVIGLIRLPVTLVPVFLVDRLGRRPLMIVSTLVSFLSLATMMIGIDVGEDLKVRSSLNLDIKDVTCSFRSRRSLVSQRCCSSTHVVLVQCPDSMQQN